MSNPKKDIETFQREMDQARADVEKAQNGDTTTHSKNQNLDAVITGAGMLLVLGLAVGFASQLSKQQTSMFAAGSVGAAGGLVLGYAVGRRKDG